MDKKLKTVTLKIANCLDCPHHKKVTSEYTGDSFDMGDVDVVCTLANGQHHGQDGYIKGRAISVSDRFAKRSECVVPTWCPLTRRTKHHDTTPEGTEARAQRGRRK